MTASKKIIQTECYEALDKVVRAGSTSGRINVPGRYVGCRVTILVLDPPAEME